jgi:hypothetical protein
MDSKNAVFFSDMYRFILIVSSYTRDHLTINSLIQKLANTSCTARSTERVAIGFTPAQRKYIHGFHIHNTFRYRLLRTCQDFKKKEKKKKKKF